MNNGWIKMHRKLIESSVFENPKLLKTWIWCLCKASHTKHEVIVGKQIVLLKEGQFVFGRLKAAEALNMNDRTVYDYMKMLQNLKMISINSNNKFSIVTVEKWDFYQCSEDEHQHQSTIENTTNTTIKNHTNNNEEECLKNDKRIFVPPSVKEVKLYCLERNNNVDAESFVSFYASKGWFVGKNKMKDWKAAVRTWERNNCQKGNRTNEKNVVSESSAKLW